jgi:hypothetical protein
MNKMNDEARKIARLEAEINWRKNHEQGFTMNYEDTMVAKQEAEYRDAMVAKLEAEIKSLKLEREKMEKIAHQRWLRIQELNEEINVLHRGTYE